MTVQRVLQFIIDKARIGNNMIIFKGRLIEIPHKVYKKELRLRLNSAWGKEAIANKGFVCLVKLNNKTSLKNSFISNSRKGNTINPARAIEYKITLFKPVLNE